MRTSKNWIAHFTSNALHQRINWELKPQLMASERAAILQSLQAWQLGETSEGQNLIAASAKYAERVGDPYYVGAVKLFIKEEQKHGNNLGRYLDAIGEQRIYKDWGDSLFRWVRYLNTSMETWTLAVIVVESTAQIFYQALKEATECELLQQICTDILIDEAYHITYQTEHLAAIFYGKGAFGRNFRKLFYRLFFYATSTLVWVGHNKVFKAGGNTFGIYIRKMNGKYLRTVNSITAPLVMQMVNG